jgi:hypothetical protein
MDVVQGGELPKLLAAQIRARVKQQIKGNERRLATMEQ